MTNATNAGNASFSMIRSRFLASSSRTSRHEANTDSIAATAETAPAVTLSSLRSASAGAAATGAWHDAYVNGPPQIIPWDIQTSGGVYEPVIADEIDALCERLNLDEVLPTR